MIDLKFLRENPDVVRESQRTRGEDPGLVDTLLEADTARRAAVLAGDNARAEQKALGKKVGQASPDERAALLDGAKELAAKVKELEVEQNAAEQTRERAHLAISNVVEGAPAGGEDDFVTLETVGDLPTFDFEPKDHLALGESLGLIDMERGAKVSGARFYFLTGYGALLQLGLLQLAAQKATANGFTMMIPPVLVRPEVMQGTGFLGQHADEVYHLEEDDLYLVGTSEVPLAGYHSGEILDLEKGPKRYAGWSSCFRREAGSYGKDVRGLNRVHQFDKVELLKWVHPTTSYDELEKLRADAERLLQKLELPYRVLLMCGGDLGFAQSKKYDLEVWAAGQKRWLEVSSCSNFESFQARRAQIRFRNKETGKPELVHTLNGSGLAVPRVLAALLENNLQADGRVKIPAALVPYFGKEFLSFR